MKALRPYQRRAVDETWRWTAKNDGNPLVVIPTGGGKSLIMGTAIREAVETWGARVLVVTHVKELITQDHAELMEIWPSAPAGIHSAGLGRRDTRQPILFCGIQSVWDKGLFLPKVDLCLVDEAHLIPRNADTRYRRFFDDLRRFNPHLRIIGYTATPFRLDSGVLHRGEDALFDDVAFEVPITHLIKNGWLVPLVSRAALAQLDTKDVAKRGNEFVMADLARAVDREEATEAAVSEFVAAGRDRRSWLVFGCSVEHAGHIADAMRRRGVGCEVVTGETPKAERKDMIDAHKAGRVKALVSVGVLTTGYNNPILDMVAILRPTQSAGLYIQMVGRGSRTAPPPGEPISTPRSTSGT